MAYLKLFERKRVFIRKLEDIRARLFRLAYSWCHQHALADDLVQETLAKALRAESQLKEIEQFDAWIFKILINTWRNYLSRTREMENIDDYTFTNEHTPEDEHQAYQVNNMVHHAINSLPNSQRQVVTLIALEGFTYAEVAGLLEIPIGTVMSRICRARKMLSSQLFKINGSTENTSTVLRRVK